MRRLITPVLALAAIVALTAPTFAGTAPIRKAVKAPVVASAMKPAPAFKASGTIKAYSNDRLTLAVKGTNKEFVLDAKTTISEGGKKLAAADLSKVVGLNASVRYTEAAGTMTATSITVLKPVLEAKVPEKAPKK